MKKEFSLCQKPKFSNPKIFDISNYFIWQNTQFEKTRSTILGCKGIKIRQSEFVERFFTIIIILVPVCANVMRVGCVPVNQPLSGKNVHLVHRAFLDYLPWTLKGVRNVSASVEVHSVHKLNTLGHR